MSSELRPPETTNALNWKAMQAHFKCICYYVNDSRLANRMWGVSCSKSNILNGFNENQLFVGGP